jgi:hypothetical protein
VAQLETTPSEVVPSVVELGTTPSELAPSFLQAASPSSLGLLLQPEQSLQHILQMMQGKLHNALVAVRRGQDVQAHCFRQLRLVH